MAAISAEQIRSAIVSTFTAGLVGPGLPVAAVFNGLTGDFGGRVPVVMITDAGTRRRARDLNGTKYRSGFRVLALIWVADADPGAGWSEADALNQIAEIDAAIADLISANRAAGPWRWLGHDDNYSEIEALPDDGGRSYLVATIPLLAEAFDE